MHARIQEFSSGGVQVSLTKALTFFFFSPQLILQKSNGQFQRNLLAKIYHFSRFQRGSNIFQGGPTFSRGGSNSLFPIETHITLDFPGGVWTPSPLLDPHLMCHWPVYIKMVHLFFFVPIPQKQPINIPWFVWWIDQYKNSWQKSVWKLLSDVIHQQWKRLWIWEINLV